MIPGAVAVSLLTLLAAATTNLWLNTAGRKVVASYLTADHLPSRTRGLFFTTLLQVSVWALTLKDPLVALTIPLIPILAVLSWVDGITHKLPTRLIQIGGLTLFVTTLATAVYGWIWPILGPTRAPLDLLTGAVLGLLIWTLPLLIVHLAGLGVGRGDVRFAPLLGAWLGAYSSGAAFAGLVCAFLIAGAAAVVKLLSGEANLATKIAFGPAMFLGAATAWLLASDAISWL